VGKEEDIYNSIVEERAVRQKLKKDSGILIKDFLMLTHLRKKQQD